jgi:hypothetical protein
MSMIGWEQGMSENEAPLERGLLRGGVLCFYTKNIANVESFKVIVAWNIPYW